MKGNSFLLIAKDYPGADELIDALADASPIQAGQVIPLSDAAFNAYRSATEIVELPERDAFMEPEQIHVVAS